MFPRTSDIKLRHQKDSKRDKINADDLQSKDCLNFSEHDKR